MKDQRYRDIHVDTGDGEELLPSQSRLSEILEALRERHEAFIVIVDAREEDGQTYLQAALSGPDSWMLEFRAGSAARHYRAAGLVDFDALGDVLRRYALRDEGWKEAVAGVVWRKIEC